MKILIYFILSILFSIRTNAQIYVDPLVAAATQSHAGIINKQLDRTNERLTLIQRGQLAVTGQLSMANDIQQRIYRGLSEVSAAVRNLLAIKDIAEISSDIVRDGKKAINLAKTNPLLLLFAEEGAMEFRTRAASLALEVTGFVTKGGKDNLMDAGERAKLLNRIVDELMVLRGVAYGLYRTMYWAKMRGILNALNPYSRFINLDNKIAEDIIRNAKHFKP